VARELTPIDVTDTPDLLRVAEEVHRSGCARLLRRADVDLAVLTPVLATNKRRDRSRTSEADRAAFLSSAGGWQGNVDVDTFLNDNERSRRLPARPPLEL